VQSNWFVGQTKPRSGLLCPQLIKSVCRAKFAKRIWSGASDQKRSLDIRKFEPVCDPVPRGARAERSSNRMQTLNQHTGIALLEIRNGQGKI
jgi:hypothetical protein